MTCTHPVIYETRDGVQVCHICGAIIARVDESPAPAEKPLKKPRKTKAD